MISLKNIVFLLIAFALFSNCYNKNNSKISVEALNTLKKKYSPEVINYFYETMFHQDGKKDKENNIIKWTKNPTVVILGTPSADEKLYVEKAVATLNKLNLGIKYNLNSKLKDGDINIYFGNDTYLKSNSCQADSANSVDGTVFTESLGGIIQKSCIGISSYIKKNGGNPEMVILEEIIQSTGCIGDSYRYTKSLFFENYNPEKHLLRIDEEVLKLLYDSLIPVNYSRIDFENDFADILYSVNTNEKLTQYISKNKINNNVLDSIERGFINGVWYKQPNDISIYLQGDYRTEDSIQVQNVIKVLNKVSNNFKMQLKMLPKQKPKVGIYLFFKKVTKQDDFLFVSNTMYRGYETMFSKRIGNDVNLSFIDMKLNFTEMQKAIVQMLLSCLGVPVFVEENVFVQKGNQIVLNQTYIDIIKTIYSNEFVDGYTIEEFNELRKTLK